MNGSDGTPFIGAMDMDKKTKKATKKKATKKATKR
jgi:hypothetical protein